jgi:hypothetical protein
MGRDNPFLAGSVGDTPELSRILSLPRRDWTRQGEELITLVSSAYARPGASVHLRAVQVAALCEAVECGGAILPMGVGTGKTLVSFLLPAVMQAKRPLLLIPAKLRDKTLREYERLQEEWVLPRLYIQTYEMLSRESNATYLETYRPDLIIADEGHKLKNPKAGVTRRVGRYIKAHRPAFVVASGTFTRRSLVDYWHLAKWALGAAYSPLPATWDEMQTWASALDGGTGFRTAPGALVRFLPSGMLPTLETVREGYRARLVGTPGVVATSTSGYDGSIVLTGVSVTLPPVLQAHFRNLRETWETPDGHPFTEAVDLWRHARELACGFYYRWNPRPPQGWLTARRVWCKFVRDTLKSSRRLDTELQVYNAVRHREIPDQLGALESWELVKNTFTPNSEPVWVDQTTLRLATQWLHSHVGIAWVEHSAFGVALGELAGVPYFGQGGKSKAGGLIEDCKGPCVASIPANSEGRNLQRYNQNLVVSCPPSGATWEQLLGRTHRPGQEEDEVLAEVFLACREQYQGFAKALEDAKYIQGTTGVPQKLCLADVSIPPEGSGAHWD